MYFDDLPVGYRFETGARTLDLEAITGFAGTWDPQPFHVDAEAAAASPYGGIIASGFHTLLTAFALTLEADVWNEASMGSPGMDDIRWRRPVRPGDTLRVHAEVIAAAPSISRADRGRTTIRYDVLNQDDEQVMQYSATHILKRKYESDSQ
ncbi:MAG: MaoC family dehydratase [Sediminimonas qiaohouensis]|uniref:MaoC family dehydratase n=1 Tax=Sediminimonas qiaohouensis TaxID=552061 RepID=A0A7C9L837_9RHOB|nr:MaoC family dehydratase [Sediminimonas qiaohouensis]MTJ04895.1 MaoC family dehydratase [Sediminimonas qiaohouensis]